MVQRLMRKNVITECQRLLRNLGLPSFSWDESERKLNVFLKERCQIFVKSDSKPYRQWISSETISMVLAV